MHRSICRATSTGSAPCSGRGTDCGSACWRATAKTAPATRRMLPIVNVEFRDRSPVGGEEASHGVHVETEHDDADWRFRQWQGIGQHGPQQRCRLDPIRQPGGWPIGCGGCDRHEASGQRACPALQARMRGNDDGGQIEGGGKLTDPVPCATGKPGAVCVGNDWGQEQGPRSCHDLRWPRTSRHRMALLHPRWLQQPT